MKLVCLDMDTRGSNNTGVVEYLGAPVEQYCDAPTELACIQQQLDETNKKIDALKEQLAKIETIILDYLPALKRTSYDGY